MITSFHGIAASAGATPAVEAPPINSVTIDNTSPIAGDTLTATVDVTGQDSITYQWKADGTNISGATGSTYVCTREDALGHAITCEAVAHLGGSSSAPATSSATSVCKGAPVCIVAPVINNNDDPTLHLTSEGTWTGYPTPTLNNFGWTGNGGDVGQAGNANPFFGSNGVYYAGVVYTDGLGAFVTAFSNEVTISNAI